MLCEEPIADLTNFAALLGSFIDHEKEAARQRKPVFKRRRQQTLFDVSPGETLGNQCRARSAGNNLQRDQR